MDNELHELAQQILRNRYATSAHTDSLFTVHDWVSAAEFALEGDYTDLAWMVARDEEADDERYQESERLGCNEADYRYDLSREDA